jgi:hypothetical protein
MKKILSVLKYIGLIITLFVFIVCLFVAIYEKDSDDRRVLLIFMSFALTILSSYLWWFKFLKKK